MIEPISGIISEKDLREMKLISYSQEIEEIINNLSSAYSILEEEYKRLKQLNKE